MTYKTIDEAINALVGSSLWQLNPLVADNGVGDGPARRVFVSRDVYSMLQPPWPQGHDARFALARQIIDSFMLGKFLTVAQKPFSKDPKAILARVKPVINEIWDFRCLSLIPGIRIFGSFAAKDTFVGISWDFRENLRRGEFSNAVKDCRQQWINLFGALPPHSGNNADDYISRPFRSV